MKKLFTLIICVNILGISFVYAWQNRLTISSQHSNLLWVQIDGRSYQLSRNDTEISLSDLRPGTRNIKVYQQRDNGRSWQGNNERNRQLLYNGNVTVREGYHLDVSINRFGKAFIDQQALGRDYGYYDDNRPGYNQQDNWNRQPMNERSFEQLKQRLRRESFDAAKMNTAKAVMGGSYLASEQVRELLGLFNFETSKLDMAKYYYRFATDPGNYYVVVDALSYSSSKNDLTRFIQQHQ